MKTFFLAIILAISSFLGHTSKSVPTFFQNVPVSTESAEVTIPAATPIVTGSPTTNKPTSIPIKISSLTPTKILYPSTAITEEVLRKFFGKSDKASIDRILNSPDLLREYDGYFLEKLRHFPVSRLAITSSTQQIVVPREIEGKLVLAVCTGEQLHKVYSDLEKYEKEVVFLQMDVRCHYGGETETKECQDWRRDNDQNRKERISNLNGETSYIYIQQQIESLPRGRFNELTGKYCRW